MMSIMRHGKAEPEPYMHRAYLEVQAVCKMPLAKFLLAES